MLAVLADWMRPDPAGAFLGALALLFTLASFWWLNTRRGRLRLVGRPRSFALATQGDKLIVTLPLSLYNSGATPVWVSNLVVRLTTPGLPSALTFVATRPGVQPQPDEDRPLATQVVLSGREARVVCCEFMGTHPTGLQLAEGDVLLELVAMECRTWGRERERSLGRIGIRVTAQIVAQQGQYLAYDNYP